MRKMFLEDLPKKNKKINWKLSVGHKVKFIYEDIEGSLKIIKYITKNNHPYLEVEYNDKTYICSSKSIIRCSLGKILNKITKDFKVEIGQTFKDEKRDLTIIDREYRLQKSNNQDTKWYKYHCNICGAELWMIESNLLNGVICACCSNKTVVKGINDVATTRPDLVKYFVNIEDAYTHSCHSGDKILCKCPNCGNVKETTMDNLNRQGFSCPKCSDGISYPNKFMFNLLHQLEVNFKTEYSPKWIKPKRYDFYIPSKNLIIEMDGAFHNNDNGMNGQTSKESKEIDNYKDKLAKEHGLKIIRIDCDYYNIKNRFDYIKNNIINSKLNEIFNLNNINWNECSLYSESSLIIEVINLKKYNPKYTTGDIKKLTGYSIPTIIRWLKIGNELKLCNYSTHKESERIINQNSIKNSKEIKMYKDGKYIDTFKNSSDLQKISKERFGVLLYACEINRVCNKRKNSYKGYYFEFVNDKPIDEIKYKKGKQVEVFKEGVSLGIYESCNELSRKSLDDFGVEFLISEISNVCNRKRKTHKGYTFKYVK